jgi:hypothetical protein
MKKLLLVLLLSLTIFSCEDTNMTGSKVNSYTPTDPNPENMQETMDTQRRGFMALSLSNFDSAAVPQIEAGSTVEIAGSLYEFGTIDSIDTTDPDTDSTVADGAVYIALFTEDEDVTAYWTATAPAWDATKQGYYQTIDSDVYRYVGGCELDSGSYSGKYIYNHQSRFFSETKTKISVYRSASLPTGGGTVLLTYDNELYDLKNEYSTSTGKVTIIKTGYYSLNVKFSAFSATSVTYVDLSAKINGVTKIHAAGIDPSSGGSVQLSVSMNKDLYLEAGDYIEIYHNSPSGQSPSEGEADCYLTLHEI